MDRGWGSVLVVAGAAVLVAVGSLLVHRAQSASFGWFAYAPLSDEVYDPAPTFAPLGPCFSTARACSGSR